MDKLKYLFYRPESLIAILLLLLVYSYSWSTENWQRGVLSSDGRGYYAYLPALFIYNDLDYDEVTEATDEFLKGEIGHHYVLQHMNGKVYNKCFPGVSICLLPLFLIAYLLSFISGLPLTGYNDLFFLSIQVSGVLAGVLSFFLMKKLLVNRGLSAMHAILIAFLVLFGSNVYYYAVNGSSFGHIYSFTAILAFFFFCQKFALRSESKYLIYISLITGLIFLIRPTNILVILMIPFFARSGKEFLNWSKDIFSSVKKLTSLILPGLVVMMILPILWYLQTGSAIVWSYTGEGFYWAAPAMGKVLFSPRNGFFIYAPLFLIGFLGLILLIKQNAFQGIVVLIYLIMNLYVISSWWTFNYGGGFGHRAMIDHAGVYTFLLAPMFTTKSFWTSTVKILGVLLLFLAQFQGWQLSKGILTAEVPSWEAYWSVFLKSSDNYIGHINSTADTKSYGHTKETIYLKPNNYKEGQAVNFSSEKEFGCESIFVLPSLEDEESLAFEGYLDKSISEADWSEIYFVFCGYDKNDDVKFYVAYELYNIRSEASSTFKNIRLYRALKHEEIEQYKFYIWNPQGKSFKIKNADYRIEIIQAI